MMVLQQFSTIIFFYSRPISLHQFKTRQDVSCHYTEFDYQQGLDLILNHSFFIIDEILSNQKKTILLRHTFES